MHVSNQDSSLIALHILLDLPPYYCRAGRLGLERPTSHANSDSDSHAWPPLQLAFFVAAAKPAHDIGVPCSNAINILIEIVESEMKVFHFNQVRHIIVH
jgi:hypothetical protein